ncbi:50S ribosomal protein L30P [Wickerhamomyces ciferrii]|uniref:50S ribosomal protein L30P n=1 Tax=Wickerhamomyces ciferrii (strain ATCC 14091 / BCRC 22168 / CBS 111 / JCM 3599 / NBRC 0793 / NRRL Y-1031 F-60-10) TaxID=1206466 RepID=K0KM59_WICCF|nr:50S ribosomal protein L30P [Wickerhamomyces ciferrii]CCH46330.1 50S ribosomal protein L30P [Wickerhamomyces ciferrii]
MPFFQVQLKRSLIGLPAKTRLTATSMGLTKTGRTLNYEINQSIAGKLLTLKELIKVDIVDEKKDREGLRKARKSDPGFIVEKQVDNQV